MFTLRRINRIITKRSYFKQTWRLHTTGTGIEMEANVISEREKLWREAQEKYSNHPKIIYSSYLECQEEHMSYRQRKSLEYKKSKVEKEGRESKLEYFKKYASTADQSTDILQSSEYPLNWMEDYEFYKGETHAAPNNKIQRMFGTADPAMLPSTVPCNGCGAHLHCKKITLPGYIPKEIFEGRTKKELQTIVCQRCHFLKAYNIALDVEVSAEAYVETISRIQSEYALAIVIVDLLDFPCSIWPGMQEVLGSKRPVFVVGNKVDLLPRDCNSYLNHIKDSLKKEMVQSGFDALNIKYVSLISAKTGYGIEELITQLHKIWRYKGDVYLLGCTNVGKSSLFNILLNSDYCRPEATDLVRKATTCPWPGTTLQMLKFPIYRPSEIRVYQRFQRLFSERAQKAAAKKLRREQACSKNGSVREAELIGTVGRTFVVNHVDAMDSFNMATGTQPISTLNERSLEYQKAKWCYDTPGVMHPEQITNLLTAEELMQITPNEMIRPRAFRLRPGMSVFLAGLARLDFIGCNERQLDWIRILVFCSLRLPIVISTTTDAAEMYNQYLGSDILGLPCGSEERLARWPGLACKHESLQIIGVHEELCLTSDVLLSSAGWVGLSIPFGIECTFKAWTPHARGIYIRTPALVPYGERLIGKRIRNSLAYNLAKPFVFRR